MQPASKSCAVNMSPLPVLRPPLHPPLTLLHLPNPQLSFLYPRRKLETLCKSHCRGRPAELCPRNPLRPPCLSKCLGDCTCQQPQLADGTAGSHPTGDANTSEAVSPRGDLTLSMPVWSGLSLVSRGRERSGGARPHCHHHKEAPAFSES